MVSGQYEDLVDRGFLKGENLLPDGWEAYITYIEDFQELESCRQVGMGVGPIPTTAILEYGRFRGIDNLQEYLFIMRCMDNGYLRAAAEKQKKSQAKAEAASKKKK